MTLRLEQPGRLSEVLLRPGLQALQQLSQLEGMLAPESRYPLPRERAEQPQVWEELRASVGQASPA
ncbi:MAG TPA: hypothetical protein PLT27_03690 [Nitrospira sp.]|nr:hypothetical protein [Nitrospira sp.]